MWVFFILNRKINSADFWSIFVLPNPTYELTGPVDKAILSAIVWVLANTIGRHDEKHPPASTTTLVISDSALAAGSSVGEALVKYCSTRSRLSVRLPISQPVLPLPVVIWLRACTRSLLQHRWHSPTEMHAPLIPKMRSASPNSCICAPCGLKMWMATDPTEKLASSVESARVIDCSAAEVIAGAWLHGLVKEVASIPCSSRTVNRPVSRLGSDIYNC